MQMMLKSLLGTGPFCKLSGIRNSLENVLDIVNLIHAKWNDDECQKKKLFNVVTGDSLPKLPHLPLLYSWNGQTNGRLMFEASV